MSAGESRSESTRSKVDFNGLVAGLATSALAVLSQVETLLEPSDEATAPSAGAEAKPLTPEERRKRVSDGLAGARQLIDTLAMLEEKTEGNLTDEEQSILRSALSELRIQFVSLANRPRPGDEREEADVG